MESVKLTAMSHMVLFINLPCDKARVSCFVGPAAISAEV